MRLFIVALVWVIMGCGANNPPVPSVQKSVPNDSCEEKVEKEEKEEKKELSLASFNLKTVDMEKEISDCLGGCHQRTPSDTSGDRVQVKLTTWDEIQEHAEKIVKEVAGDTMPVGGGNDAAMVKLFKAWKKGGYEREVVLKAPATGGSGKPSPQSPATTSSKCATRPKAS